MNAQEIGLAVSVLLAAGVEMIEALTIVLAVGITRDWKSALRGAGTAVLVLAAIIAALGPLLAQIPIGILQVCVGIVLLYLGLTWLRKAVLRAAGRKALHDEAREYAEQTAAAREADRVEAGKLDRYAFSVAFQGVLVEGLEVVFIVLSFGSGQHRVALAAAAAALSAVIVAGAGLALRRPLSSIPENPMKYAVGVLLTAFGVYWLLEGLGGRWPGGEASLAVLAGAVFLVSLVAVSRLRERGA